MAALLLAVAAESARAQDYGTDSGWRFVYDHEEYAGLVAGVRLYHLRYGPRRLTWAERVDVTGRVSMRGGVGVDGAFQRRVGETPTVLALAGGAARRLRSYRFYGYGNDARLIDTERALVPLDEVWAEATVEWPVLPAATLQVGPSLLRVWPRPHDRGPLARLEPPGSAPFSQLGLTSRLLMLLVDDVRFPRFGFGVSGEASVYPALLDVERAFGGVDLEVRGYLPLPLGAAFAARGRSAFAAGGAPVHEAAFVGGSETLRGHAPQRFAGDGALSGSVEVRLPLLSLPELRLERLGVLGFADAGRVYVDGESPGGWHRAEGVGLWADVRRVTVTAVHAWGEERRVHLYLGLPF